VTKKKKNCNKLDMNEGQIA